MNRSGTTGFLTAAVVLASDQLSKAVVLAGLRLGEPVRVLGDYVRLTRVRNSGAAFGLSWGGSLVISIVTGVAVIVLGIMIWKRPAGRSTAAGMGAVLGGALGNLTDRLVHGWVVDFLDVGVGRHRWPTFNLADVAITLGGLFLVFFSGGFRRKG